MSFTQSADLELFSGGEFTNQGRGGHGLLKWVERGDDLAGQPVLWHSESYFRCRNCQAMTDCLPIVSHWNDAQPSHGGLAGHATGDDATELQAGQLL